MKLSKRDIKGLGELGSFDFNELPPADDSTAQQKAMITTLDKAYRLTLTKLKISEGTISIMALKQILEGLYWRYKVDWTGEESSFNKLFNKTFAGPVAKLKAAKQTSTIPGIGVAVMPKVEVALRNTRPQFCKNCGTTLKDCKSKRNHEGKPCCDKCDHTRWTNKQIKAQSARPVSAPIALQQAIQANIGEAQIMQTIHEKLEALSVKLAEQTEILVKIDASKAFMVANPRCKITDDNFFKVFSASGNDTLIPMVEVNLVTDPIVEMMSTPYADYIIETKSGSIITILLVPTQTRKDDNLLHQMQSQVSAGFSDDIMPDDIAEVL